MAIQDLITLSKCILYCSLLTLISSLTLQSTATQKTRYTKYSSSTPDDSIVTPGIDVGLYRLETDNGTTCILLRTDAFIEIRFKSDSGDETCDTYIPEKPTISGNCENENSAAMTLSWEGHSLLLVFAKTPGGERWYVKHIELTVSTDVPTYNNIKAYGSSFELVHDRMLFPTPIGKSFWCDESVIPLKNQYKLPGLSGTLFVRLLQLQPFMSESSNFGQAFKCNEQTSPMAAGSTLTISAGSILAAALVMTVSGYGIFRYFKRRKDMI